MPAPHRHIQHASREVFAIARAESVARRHLRDRVLDILWVTFALDVIFTLVVWLAERHAAQTEIRTLWDAFLFSTSQLLTASSVATPHGELAKVLELISDLYAITVVAALAGSFGAFFHKRAEEKEAEAQLPDEPNPPRPRDVSSSSLASRTSTAGTGISTS